MGRVSGMNGASSSDNRKRLEELFPGRKAEIGELLSVLGEPRDVFPPILLYGSTATGKTSVMRETMALLKRPFAYVSCRSCHSPRLVFESVLNQLLGHVRCKANNYASAKKCEKLSDFVAHLEEASAVACSRAEKCKDSLQKVVYLIFDDVELVRGWMSSGTLLSSLVKLPQLTRLQNLGLVFISSAGPDTLQLGTSARELLPLYFREYTNEELYAILVKWYPNSELYSFFLKTSLPPFSRASRMLTDLSEGLHPLFEKFCEPVIRGMVEPKDRGRRELFAYLKGHMQSALSRTFSIADSDTSNGRATTLNNETRKTGDSNRPDEFHLSLCSKYLLLASYIASRNPSKLDDALFGTGDAMQTKKRKRKASMSAMEKKDADMHEQHLKGPSNYPMERLLAIYKCVTVESDFDSEGLDRGSLGHGGQQDEEGNGAGVTADVLMQLANLTSVNLVLRSSSSPLDGFPKFRSNVDADFIHKTSIIRRVVRVKLHCVLIGSWRLQAASTSHCRSIYFMAKRRLPVLSAGVLPITYHHELENQNTKAIVNNRLAMSCTWGTSPPDRLGCSQVLLSSTCHTLLQGASKSVHIALRNAHALIYVQNCDNLFLVHRKVVEFLEGQCSDNLGFTCYLAISIHSRSPAKKMR